VCQDRQEYLHSFFQITLATLAFKVIH